MHVSKETIKVTGICQKNSFFIEEHMQFILKQIILQTSSASVVPNFLTMLLMQKTEVNSISVYMICPK